MRDYNGLSYTRRDCKNKIVFIPKKRKEFIYGAIKKYVDETLYDLAKRKGVIIGEGHLMPGYIHVYIRILLKYALSNVVGYLKDKSAKPIARKIFQRRCSNN